MTRNAFIELFVQIKTNPKFIRRNGDLISAQIDTYRVQLTKLNQLRGLSRGEDMFQFITTQPEYNKKLRVKDSVGLLGLTTSYIYIDKTRVKCFDIVVQDSWKYSYAVRTVTALLTPIMDAIQAKHFETSFAQNVDAIMDLDIFGNNTEVDSDMPKDMTGTSSSSGHMGPPHGANASITPSELANFFKNGLVQASEPDSAQVFWKEVLQQVPDKDHTNVISLTLAHQPGMHVE